MSANELRKILREEYGIQNDMEFEAAASNSTGLNLGLFTYPYKGGETSEGKT